MQSLALHTYMATSRSALGISSASFFFSSSFYRATFLFVFFCYPSIFLFFSLLLLLLLLIELHFLQFPLLLSQLLFPVSPFLSFERRHTPSREFQTRDLSFIHRLPSIAGTTPSIRSATHPPTQLSTLYGYAFILPSTPYTQLPT